jgi:pectinesterase
MVYQTITKKIMPGRLIILVFAWMLIRADVSAQGSSKVITVDPTGKGDFRNIQGAINSLSDSSTNQRKILIRNGVYAEKIYIEKANILLEGEDREKTIIISSIARDEWRCGHADDWGVATMNVGANDISLKNITVTNNYGFDFTEKTIWCTNDTSSNKQKLIRKDGHQMALRTMNATRFRAVNCHFRSFGGDTVSPWQVDNGMWYFKDCVMEGGVDFYCPRGWAWAENCEFITHTGSAAIWHDGSLHESSKTVLVNCRFSGYDGFMLGRYHRDAQFFLVNCVFAKNMKDTAIYLVATANTILWGKRIYYFNCHREGGSDYPWYSNRLPEGLKEKDITVQWVFGSSWNPTIN